MTPESRQLLEEGASHLGVEVRDHLDTFAQLQTLLQDASAKSNLTALHDERDIVLKHFVDSLSCLRGGHLDGELRVLDLGTGAGFPGLPLAIVRPDLTLALLDATRRKVEFVEETIRALTLPNARGLVGRAEALGRDPAHRGRYDRVVTRAVSALPVLVELALPLLRVGGQLVAQKARLDEAELEAGGRAAATVGGRVTALERFALPVLGDPRALVVVEKTRETPARFPRREGTPAKHPLS